MAVIKSYTDIEQSKKLAEILPIESADMYYMETSCNNYTIGVLRKMERDMLFNQAEYYKMFPCWSLAALLKLIPNFNMFKRTIECKIETTNHLIDKACDLVDAAFEMVCWLKENNEL